MDPPRKRSAKSCLGDGRTVRQYVALAPLWMLFFWGWYLILFRWPFADLVGSIRLLALTSSLCGIVITLWVRHNIRIYQVKGPRSTVRRVVSTYAHDVLGKLVELPPPNELTCSHILLTIEDGKKRYRCAPVSKEYTTARSGVDQLFHVGMDSSH
jgi:hypothetical protein